MTFLFSVIVTIEAANTPLSVIKLSALDGIMTKFWWITLTVWINWMLLSCISHVFLLNISLFSVLICIYGGVIYSAIVEFSI
jgi:hypothetical protein